MGHQDLKCSSRYMLIVAQGTTLFKAKSAATLVSMETNYAGNAMLAGHTKLKNLMKDFIVSLRWVMIASHS
jgi:CO/xanthine dehydrogenase FAD-binding subunit